MRYCFLVLLTWMMSSPSMGQFVREIPPELEKLEFLIGEWKAEGDITIAGKTSKHSSHHQLSWAVKGRWIEERVQAKFPNGGPMEGIRWMTYSQAKQSFVSFWIDVQLDAPVEMTGQLTGPQTLVLNGTLEWKGETHYFKTVIAGRDKNTLEVNYFHGLDPNAMKANSSKTWKRQST